MSDNVFNWTADEALILNGSGEVIADCSDAPDPERTARLMARAGELAKCTDELRDVLSDSVDGVHNYQRQQNALQWLERLSDDLPDTTGND